MANGTPEVMSPSMEDPCLGLDAGGELTHINPAAVRFVQESLGMAPRELEGCGAGNRVLARFGPSFESACREAVTAGVPTQVEEHVDAAARS